jgi:hypothetical protein
MLAWRGVETTAGVSAFAVLIDVCPDGCRTTKGNEPPGWYLEHQVVLVCASTRRSRR